MDEREQKRKIRHRLAALRHAEDVTGNISATCRYYGISRPTFYKSLRRYEEHGEAGLRDGSSRPHHSPLATSPEVVGKIDSASTITLPVQRSRCTWPATTTSRSVSPGYGASSSGST